ncbi:MAG: MBL fold metallo-hydrolase [Planctomycetota bacterium]
MGTETGGFSRSWEGIGDTQSSRLLTLGTGSILMGQRRSAPGYLLLSGKERILLDAGPGSLLRLHQAGIHPGTLTRVLLSHFHPDHHGDLLGLLFLRKSPALAGGLGRLPIHGPPGLRDLLERWFDLYGTWIRDPSLEIREVPEGWSELGRWRLCAFPAKHTRSSYCYRLETDGGRSLAYSGDSESCDGLVEACMDAGLALIECSFPDELAVAGHMCPRRVHCLLEEARPRRAGLTHFYPPMEDLLMDREAWSSLWSDLDTEVEALDDLRELVL